MTTRESHKRSVSLITRSPISPPTPPIRATTVGRKPRRQVGDKVFVCSPTAVFFAYNDDNSKFVVIENATKNGDDDCDQNMESKCQEIRRTKDLPKLVSRIFEESLESQEINFYIGIEDYSVS